MKTLIGCTATFSLSILNFAHAACPQLAGEYKCLTSMSSKSEPWSLQQSIDSNGSTIYAFDNKEYIADGVERADTSVAYLFLHTTTCTTNEMVVNGKGEYNDRGKLFHFKNQLVQFMKTTDQLVSEYWHEGSLIDRMVCTRR